MVSTDMKTIQDAALYRRIQLSALADGELRGVEFAEAMTWFDGDDQDAAQTRASWRALHVVGDVLRSGDMAACRGDTAFLSRLQSALKQEAGLKPGPDLSSGATHPVHAIVAQSANEPVFRWQWVVGLSSFAAVLAISWNLVGGVAATSEAQLVQNANPLVDLALQSGPANVPFTTAVPHDATGVVMLRNPQLDAMIAAHSQLGGSSALQMPSGFLRNATFDAASNGSVR